MDCRRRNLTIMHQFLHLSYDLYRLYVSRKEGRRGLIRIEDSINASIQRLEDYIEIREGDWLQKPEIILTTQGSTEGK